jgi:HAD superfamily hydrolase (TIGR01509 family)
MDIRALIFDFDGLILETEGPIFQSWQELYQKYGSELSFDTWGTIIGTSGYEYDPYDQLEKQLGSAIQRDALELARAQRETELIKAQPILPGVEDYLSAASKARLKIGLASSSTFEWVEGHLSRLGLLAYFDTIKTKEDVHITKPDPELYLSVLREFDLHADQALVFEDSPNGILAARRAGIFCIAVPNELTRRLPLNQANLILDSLTDISLEKLICKVSESQTK